jgi:uncharacterized protein (DUF433 family)
MQLPDFLDRNKYGEIRLTGHRIGLIQIVDRYNEGYSPEGIVAEFPTLPLATIHKVIGFYLENRAETDRYVEACRSEIDRQATAPPQGPDTAELRRRLEKMRAAGTKTV